MLNMVFWLVFLRKSGIDKNAKNLTSEIKRPKWDFLSLSANILLGCY